MSNISSPRAISHLQSVTLSPTADVALSPRFTSTREGSTSLAVAADLQHRLVTAESELSLSRADRKQQAAAIADLQRRLTAPDNLYRITTTNMDTKLLSARTEIEQHITTQRRLEVEIEDWEKNLAAAEKELTASHNTTQKALASLSLINRLPSSQQAAEIASLQKCLATAEAKLQQDAATVADLHTQSRQQSVTIYDLQRRLGTADTELAVCRAESQQQATSISDTEKRLATSKTELAVTREESRHQVASISDLQTRLATTESELAASRAELQLNFKVSNFFHGKN